ncbi:LPXTG cell wall anchor domain-containing protein [Leucobacter luti]|nr:LPXTG cell wall anchor domain-containing protein [Leucobacter luti]
MLAKGQVPGTNYHGLTFAADGAELLVGGEKVIQVVGADDLTIQRAIALPNFTSVGDLSYDTDPSRLYVSDSTGSRLGVLDPASGVLLASAPVGNPMAMIVGSDEHNRAYGNVPYWDMIMSANFDTGARSESYRATPTAPFSLSSNPATGDLLSANAGWSNGVKGSTVSIVYAPGVTDPADVAITALEGEAVFTTAVTGIKPRGGGALQWQSSDDGVEWADVPGATGDELAVAVNAETLAQSYRVRWSDAFWGASGESAAARIVTPAPAITLDTPLPAGVVGEAYEDTAITASGQADLQWSVDGMTRTTPGLPVGLALDPATGVLSGTPEAEGDYVLTVTVTDVFGSDTREFPLTVTANAAVTPPVTPPVAPPVTPPGTSNPDTSNPDTTGPDTTNPDTTAPGATDDAQPGTSGSADAPAQTQAGAGSAQLAQTGAADPLWLLGAGLVLLGFGAVIVLRRRTTAR